MEKQFEQKFIAFIDILGFKSLVKKAENNQGIDLRGLLEFTSFLHNEDNYQNILHYGPSICPKSKKFSGNLRLEVTQISDCVISSSEVSPAGLINLISHSWGSIFKLMEKGIMCRGFITKGSIYHRRNQIIGTGYLKALEMEYSNIQVYKKEVDETGTPFVEIDQMIKAYVVQLLSENNNAVKSEIKDVGFSENKNVGISENSDACF